MVQLTMTLVTNFAPKGLRHVAWGWRFLPAPGRRPKHLKSPEGATAAHRSQRGCGHRDVVRRWTAAAPSGLRVLCVSAYPGLAKSRQPRATCLCPFGASCVQREFSTTPLVYDRGIEVHSRQELLMTLTLSIDEHIAQRNRQIAEGMGM